MHAPCTHIHFTSTQTWHMRPTALQLKPCSIEYDQLRSHFYLFGILQREGDHATWLSWQQVCARAEELQIPTGAPSARVHARSDLTKKILSFFPWPAHIRPILCVVVHVFLVARLVTPPQFLSCFKAKSHRSMQSEQKWRPQLAPNRALERHSPRCVCTCHLKGLVWPLS